MKLEELLNNKRYIQFLKDIAGGKYFVKEIEDLKEELNLDSKRLEKVLTVIGKRLLQKHYTVLYPVEMIVIPRYPFSKRPLIEWKPLQMKDYGDAGVTKIKEITGRLGNLINCGFLLRNFVLIDVDSSNIPAKVEFDIKTRRGYHKLFYIPKYKIVEFTLDNVRGVHIKIKCNDVEIELMSGSGQLGSHPLQSRYLEISNGKVNVRSYKILSKRAEYSFRSADLTPLESSIDDVRAFLEELLRKLGCEEKLRQLELVPKEEEEISTDITNVNPRESRFNVNRLTIVGGLSYGEFKKILEPKQSLLPVCFKKALYDNIDKGHRYFHLRLLVAILPYFVALDEKNIEELVSDFAERTNSTRGEIREWVYHSKYFTGKMKLDEKELHVPSKLGVPSEAWSDFRELGYCSVFPFRESCSRLEGSKRRRLIVEYIENLMGR